MPFCSPGFHLLVHVDRALMRRSAHCKLHAHGRESQNCEEEEIDQHKSAAAILSAQIRKSPYIADADRTACADQNKTQTAAQRFSLHCFQVPFLCKYFHAVERCRPPGRHFPGIYMQRFRRGENGEGTCLCAVTQHKPHVPSVIFPVRNRLLISCSGNHRRRWEGLSDHRPVQAPSAFRRLPGPV